MKLPETQFARIGDDRVAYQLLGEGPPDLVLTIGSGGHVDARWDDPPIEDFLRRLATLGRLITFDGRGTGASDPLPEGTSFAWESWVDDLGAVMESAASERAVIIGGLDAGPATILFAVTQPERTAGLVLFNTTARLLEAPDYPIGYPPEVGRALVDFAKEKWGTAEMAAFLYPERAGDEHFCIWYSKFQRAAASPRVFAEHMEQTLEIDVREYLPLVQAPTLVMMRPGAAIPMTHGHYLAERIPGAQFVELPGRGNGMMGQHVDQTVATLREFLTGAPSDAEPERVLATILFTDIVDSTGRASAAGDRRWREFLDRHERTARAEVVRFRGRFVGSTGDGILATFDTPTRAVRCAFELAEVLRSAGIEIRAGVHTGEIELRGEDVAGIGVHIAARTIAEAGAGEVVVTRTVRDLATGTNLTFISRGSKKLRGIPDKWELFDAQLKQPRVEVSVTKTRDVRFELRLAFAVYPRGQGFLHARRGRGEINLAQANPRVVASCSSSRKGGSAWQASR